MKGEYKDHLFAGYVTISLAVKAYEIMEKKGLTKSDLVHKALFYFIHNDPESQTGIFNTDDQQVTNALRKISRDEAIEFDEFYGKK